jgi:hypothetical protein
MPSLFCATCVDYLLTSQWQKYVDQLAKASCKAEQRRLLDKGPPINISVSSSHNTTRSDATVGTQCATSAPVLDITAYSKRCSLLSNPLRWFIYTY